MQYSQVQKTENVLSLGKHTTQEVLDAVQSMNYHRGLETKTGNALSRVSTEVGAWVCAMKNTSYNWLSFHVTSHE